MKAVICAAGSGKRLMPHTTHCPKPVVVVGQKTILEYLLDAIVAAGITEAVIVVGYQSHTVRELIGKHYKQCTITYVDNPEYATTQNIYSLWLARHEITDGMIFFNGDIIVHPRIVERLVKSPYPDAIMVDTEGVIVDDAMKVLINDGRMVEIGKKISAPANGWAFGMYKLSQPTSETYFATAKQLFDDGEKNVSFVVPLQTMAPVVPLMVVSNGGHPWVEIDTVEDLEEAKRRVGTIVPQTL